MRVLWDTARSEIIPPAPPCFRRRLRHSAGRECAGKARCRRWRNVRRNCRQEQRRVRFCWAVVNEAERVLPVQGTQESLNHKGAGRKSRLLVFFYGWSAKPVNRRHGGRARQRTSALRWQPKPRQPSQSARRTAKPEAESGGTGGLVPTLSGNYFPRRGTGQRPASPVCLPSNQSGAEPRCSCLSPSSTSR